jgi:hypothetical protein
MLLRCSKRAPMRQYPRQTIHTDKLPAWAGVQLRPLFVSHCSPHFSHPSLTGRRCTSQEPMSERDLTRHVCRVLSFAVVRYRSGLLKKIASSEKSLQLYRLVSKEKFLQARLHRPSLRELGGRNWKGSCSCRKLNPGAMRRVHDRRQRMCPAPSTVRETGAPLLQGYACGPIVALGGTCR